MHRISLKVPTKQDFRALQNSKLPLHLCIFVHAGLVCTSKGAKTIHMYNCTLRAKQCQPSWTPSYVQTIWKRVLDLLACTRSVAVVHTGGKRLTGGVITQTRARERVPKTDLGNYTKLRIFWWRDQFEVLYKRPWTTCRWPIVLDKMRNKKGTTLVLKTISKEGASRNVEECAQASTAVYGHAQ